MRDADRPDRAPLLEASAPGGNPFAVYSAEKAAWLRANPNAMPEQVEAACRALAERLGI